MSLAVTESVLSSSMTVSYKWLWERICSEKIVLNRLITWRSQVQVLPPQPFFALRWIRSECDAVNRKWKNALRSFSVGGQSSEWFHHSGYRQAGSREQEGSHGAESRHGRSHPDSCEDGRQVPRFEGMQRISNVCLDCLFGAGPIGDTVDRIAAPPFFSPEIPCKTAP